MFSRKRMGTTKSPRFALIGLVATLAIFVWGGVPQKTEAATITVTPSSVAVAPGEIHQLTATINPVGTQRSIIWSSSNRDIATVDIFGRVRGIAHGTATIRASVISGAAPGESTVTVAGEGRQSPAAQWRFAPRSPVNPDNPRPQGRPVPVTWRQLQSQVEEENQTVWVERQAEETVPRYAIIEQSTPLTERSKERSGQLINERIYINGRWIRDVYPGPRYRIVWRGPASNFTVRRWESSGTVSGQILPVNGVGVFHIGGTTPWRDVYTHPEARASSVTNNPGTQTDFAEFEWPVDETHSRADVFWWERGTTESTGREEGFWDSHASAFIAARDRGVNTIESGTVTEPSQWFVRETVTDAGTGQVRAQNDRFSGPWGSQTIANSNRPADQTIAGRPVTVFEVRRRDNNRLLRQFETTPMRNVEQTRATAQAFADAFRDPAPFHVVTQRNTRTGWVDVNTIATPNYPTQAAAITAIHGMSEPAGASNVRNITTGTTWQIAGTTGGYTIRRMRTSIRLDRHNRVVHRGEATPTGEVQGGFASRTAAQNRINTLGANVEHTLENAASTNLVIHYTVGRSVTRDPRYLRSLPSGSVLRAAITSFDGAVTRARSLLPDNRFLLNRTNPIRVVPNQWPAWGSPSGSSGPLGGLIYRLGGSVLSNILHYRDLDFGGANTTSFPYGYYAWRLCPVQSEINHEPTYNVALIVPARIGTPYEHIYRWEIIPPGGTSTNYRRISRQGAPVRVETDVFRRYYPAIPTRNITYTVHEAPGSTISGRREISWTPVNRYYTRTFVTHDAVTRLVQVVRDRETTVTGNAHVRTRLEPHREERDRKPPGRRFSLGR